MTGSGHDGPDSAGEEAPGTGLEPAAAPAASRLWKILLVVSLAVVVPTWYSAVVPLLAWRELLIAVQAVKDREQHVQPAAVDAALDTAESYAPASHWVGFYRGLWDAIQGRPAKAAARLAGCREVGESELGPFFSRVLLPSLQGGAAPELDFDEFGKLPRAQAMRLASLALYRRELGAASGLLADSGDGRDGRNPQLQRLEAMLLFLRGEVQAARERYERAWNGRSAWASVPDLGIAFTPFRFRIESSARGLVPHLTPWEGRVTTLHRELQEAAAEMLFNLAVLHSSQGNFRRSLYFAQMLAGSHAGEAASLGLDGPLQPYLYPRNFAKGVSEGSARHGLDPMFVHALIREESHYDAGSISPAGAIGLMQLMPQTGRWIAAKLRLTRFQDAQLKQPLLNIEMGCWYLTHLAQALPPEARRIEWLLAAYNAGPAKAAQWQARWRVGGGLPANHIPVAETRDYVVKVLRSYEQYRKIWGPTAGRG